MDNAILAGDSFVVGDSRGVDTMTQEYLASRTKLVTVYHIKNKPLFNKGKFATNGKYKTQTQKDAAMTLHGSKYRKRTSGTKKI